MASGLKAEVTAASGNKAAAIGVKLSRPGLISAYPITPQTPLVEYLADFVARGILDAEMVEVESEHSALSVLHGACLGGLRTFTATSAVGLALMFEPYLRTSTLRLPIVMAIANREITSPMTVWGGQQDSMTVRDAGWIQLYVEDNQEILDSVIMAYRLAEDPRVVLPVNVCYDGFFLSHLVERIEIPVQDVVDRFLPPFQPMIRLDSRDVLSMDPLTPGDLLTRYRFEHTQALARAEGVLDEIDGQFRSAFGRGYGGALEAYRTDDAEVVLITTGSMTGAARVAIENLRGEGHSVGLIKLRLVRPFPSARLVELLRGKKAVGVVDRSVSFGWGAGTVYTELKQTVSGQPGISVPHGFIAGLGGLDITIEHMERALTTLLKAARGQAGPPVTWLDLPHESTGAAVAAAGARR